MNTVDFSKQKFHPSSLSKLMTNTRTTTKNKIKTINEPLSVTAKGCLHEIYIEEVFGRSKTISSAAMKKGTAVETDSLELLQTVTGEVYFKNQETIENDYLIGTPDVIDKKNSKVVDIKSSWDIWTYSRVTGDSALKDYAWQVKGYMWLTDTRSAQLVYALVNTPEFIIDDELYKMSFTLPPETDMEQFRPDFIFDDIPSEMRIKRFEVAYFDEEMSELRSRLDLCREYLSTLKL